MLYVVTGPPAAGKTTWVMAKATARDIVIDYDRLAVALAGPGADSHDHNRVLKKVAHKARYAAIATAMEHLNGGADVYLIHSMPSDTNLARYKDAGARIITVDPGRDVVQERCQRERPTHLAVVGKWYAWHARQSAPAPVAPAAAPALAPAERRASRAW